MESLVLQGRIILEDIKTGLPLQASGFTLRPRDLYKSHIVYNSIINLAYSPSRPHGEILY